ncbi:MAG: hypothetical protein F4Z31_22965 [Gemmatimonadetes bacterium]|nr:hypothetical protein [Gemmatimonadota bacterium]MYE92513.1 hypothetical protein [Gemmatimonadota bacterium]MYJ09638.1 hypothetical protein [Gemmatimonadota bacterium]
MAGHDDTTTVPRQIVDRSPSPPALDYLLGLQQPSRGVLGLSDGNEGVQWNAGYRPGDGFVWLGLNLEGMQYDDWPVARLLEREIGRPLLLTRYPRKGRKTR